MTIDLSPLAVYSGVIFMEPRGVTHSNPCLNWAILSRRGSCSHTEMWGITGTMQIALGQLGTSMLYVIMLMVLWRWVRTGEEGRAGCAVLMCNGDEGWFLVFIFNEEYDSPPLYLFFRYKSMEVGKVYPLLLCTLLMFILLMQEHVNERWTDVLGWHPGEVIIGEDGWGMFRCPAMSVSIWVSDAAKGRQEFQKH